MFPAGPGLDMEARGHEMGKNWAVFAGASYVRGRRAAVQMAGGASKQAARRPQGFNAIICQLSVPHGHVGKKRTTGGGKTRRGGSQSWDMLPTAVGAR